MFSDPNPIPDMDRNYPYFRFDGYTNKSEEQKWKMVILENDYIKVFIAPEIGGKIWGAIEKSTGGEFLYYNDAVKFRDVAHRGPWTSGGLEYNFGLMGHVSTCSTPQDYVIKENADGSVSCIIAAIDLHTRTKWNVEVTLPADKAYFETKASWFNTCSVPVTYYHYMNAAAKTEGNLEFIFPGNHYIGHGGELGDWPVEHGREIGFYENNNFGPYKSYHVINAYSDFFGGYWHEDDFGFGHLGNYDDRPGKKLWIWGLSEQGMIWEDLLTDSKGQYIEFQSGKLFNQAMEKSSYTPFRHREFIPHDTDIMREVWFPIKETGGMVAASKHGVLNAKRVGDQIEIKLSALQHIKQKLVVKTDDEMVSDNMIELNPLELYQSKVKMNSNADFTIELGDDLLFYSSNPNDVFVNRPVEPNPEFNWDSAIGLYTRGMELEKQQSYIDGHANKMAHELYLKSLELDPAYAPALNRLALSHYKRMEYEKALNYTLKSLAIDTYDPEANYFFGLINLRLDKFTDAKSGFSIAAQSTAYRNASYTELARLFLSEKRFSKAIEYAKKALAFNQRNVVAHEILIIAARQMNKLELAEEKLTKLYDLDKTGTFYIYENILRGKMELASLQELISNEFPFESYLRLAIKYYHYGFPQESIKILKTAPIHAVGLLWLAFLDVDNQKDWLKRGLEATPEFIFPFRGETLEVLNHFMKISNNWKLKYYASLILWKKGLLDQAKDLISQCGNEPNYVPFYLSKANLFEDDEEIKEKAILKAMSLNDTDWRANLALVNEYMDNKEYESAAKLSKSVLAKHPEMSALGISYGSALLKLSEYGKCLNFLESYEVLPYEGSNDGRNIYHEACIRAALEGMKKNKYKKVIEYAQKAMLWPVNLGAGKPYDVDERFENYIIAQCYEKMGMSTEAKEYFTKVIDHETSDYIKENAFLYLQISALKRYDKQKEANDLLDGAMDKAPDNKYLKWMEAVEKQEKSDILTKNIVNLELEKTSHNNEFLLLIDFLKIVD